MATLTEFNKAVALVLLGSRTSANYDVLQQALDSDLQDAQAAAEAAAVEVKK